MSEQSKQAKKPETKYLNDGLDLPVVYTNHTEVTASTNFDVRLRFGQVHEGSDSLLVVKRVGEVFMTEEHARKIIDQLTQALDSLKAIRDEKAK